MYNQYCMAKDLLMKIAPNRVLVALYIVSGCTLAANDKEEPYSHVRSI